MRRWSLAPLVFLAACAAPRTATIDAATVDRMPEAMRQSLLAEEEAVNSARDQIEVDERALDDARAFSSRTGQELAVAAGRVQPRPLAALRAKRDYADRLLAFRQARLQESQIALAAAQSDYKVAALHAFERAGTAGSIDANRIYAEKRSTDDQLARARLRSARFQTLVAQARTRWDLERRAQAAGRGWIVIPPETPPDLLAPPARPSSQPPPDVNGGPSSPQSVPLPTPEQLP